MSSSSNENDSDNSDSSQGETFISADYSDHFSTTEVWSDRDQMIEWVRTVGRNLIFLIVIKKSWQRKVLLSCEKSGSYRPLSKRVKKKRLSESRKTECPFQINGLFRKGDGKEDGTWGLVVVHGWHNHELPDSLHGHSRAGRLTKEQYKLVVSMSAAGQSPSDIYSYLHDNYPGCLAMKNHINNAKSNERRLSRRDQTILQYTLSYLRARDYYVDVECVPGTNLLSDLFIFPPSSRHLLNLFPNVVILDSTYKTNRYNLPLLEIVGFTCTNLTFCIAIVFMKYERFENYEWALKRLRHVFGGKLLTAILSDREMGLLKAASSVFPLVKHLLCRVHIHRNVEIYIKDRVKDEDTVHHFTGNIRWLFRSPTEEIYNSRHEWLTKKWGGLMRYVDNVWLTPYKEYIVSAWSDSVLHFATRSRNRVESQHAMLKGMIHNSVGGLDSLVEHFDRMFRNQVRSIKEAMERSRDRSPTEVKFGEDWVVRTLFRRLICRVSSECLRILNAQATLVRDGKFNDGVCNDHHWRMSMGLPCPHEIKNCMDRGVPIKPSQIHNFWKQLKWEKIGPQDLLPDDDKEFTNPEIEMRELIPEFESGKMDSDLMFNLIAKRRDYIHSSISMVQEPLAVEAPRGRPPKKKSSSTKRDPSLFEHKEEERKKKLEEK